MPSDVAIVYLSRKAEGWEPLRRFIGSYRAKSAGHPHDLVIVLKGYGGDDDVSALHAILGGLPHRSIAVDDRGFDIGAYIEAAARLKSDYGLLCFLNSFSEIAADGWLAKLRTQIDRPGVGIAGATGSYESIHDSRYLVGKVAWLCELRGFRYDSRVARHFAFALADHAKTWLARGSGGAGLIRQLAWRIANRLDAARLDREFEDDWAGLIGPKGPLAGFGEFPRFPNPHIRSNCFMISAPLLSSLSLTVGASKRDAYDFESGVDSLTSLIRRRGLAALVVGRDDRGYDVDEWPQSRTFRLGLQDNLLVTDNQVRAFATMSAEERAVHVLMTWGEYVLPRRAGFPSLGCRFRRGDLSARPI